jgi:tRNA nucleotidyltransferase/poly(A) polymerase
MFETVLRRLEPFAQEFSRHGKQVYLVGGAVRNLLLGRPVQDYDFTTDARPEEVRSFFKRVIPTGLQHGTVTVLFQGESYEVTTFRVDGDYTDGRRPDRVLFTPSLEEDLERRDFTINAVALNLSDGTLTDPHDGRGDLKRGVLRAIGRPGLRFDEDALRLLRLFRFASQLGFAIDQPTLEAVPSRRSRLSLVSKERIREELAKAMAGAYPALALGPLADLGFLADLFAPLTVRVLPSSTLDRLGTLPTDLRWSFWMTAACFDGRKAWEPALRSLTFSNADLAAFLGPTKALDFLDPAGAVSQTAKALIETWGSRDRVTLGVRYLTALEEDGFWSDRRGLKDELLRIATSNEPVFVADLAVGGKDLIDEGVSSGPQVGQILKTLQKEVWNDPALNSADALRKRVRSLR